MLDTRGRFERRQACACAGRVEFQDGGLLDAGNHPLLLHAVNFMLKALRTFARQHGAAFVCGELGVAEFVTEKEGGGQISSGVLQAETGVPLNAQVGGIVEQVLGMCDVKFDENYVAAGPQTPYGRPQRCRLPERIASTSCGNRLAGKRETSMRPESGA